MVRLKDLPQMMSVVVSLVVSWMVCLGLTLVRILVPKQIASAFAAHFPSIFIPADGHLLPHLFYKQDLGSGFLALLKSATSHFITYIKEICLVVLLLHWRSDIFNWLPSLEDFGIYSDKSSDEIGDDMSSDNDSCPPPLIADPALVFPVSSSPDVNGNATPAAPQDPLVFDPIFGVIPQSLQQQWAAEEQQRNECKRRHIQRRLERPSIPPVRNSDIDGDHHRASDGRYVNDNIIVSHPEKLSLDSADNGETHTTSADDTNGFSDSDREDSALRIPPHQSSEHSSTSEGNGASDQSQSRLNGSIKSAKCSGNTQEVTKKGQLRMHDLVLEEEDMMLQVRRQSNGELSPMAGAPCFD